MFEMLIWVYNGLVYKGNNMFEAKYLDVADRLEAKINEGKWKKKLPGVSVLSRELNINSRTVSKALRVLSEKGTIQIIPSSGTFIRGTSRKTRHYGAIGVLGMLHDHKKTAGMDIIEDLARENDYHVLSIDHCDEVFKAKPEILLNIPVDGFIFTNSTITPQIVSDLTQAEIPFVSVNRISELENVNWIDFNHEKANREIVEHLYSLGHRRIAYVMFKPNLAEHARRMEKLYRTMMDEKGIYDASLYVNDGDLMEYYHVYGEHYSSVYGMEKTSYLMSMPDRPTAIVAFSQEMAHGVCSQLQKMGIRIPQDMSVVGTTQDRNAAEREKILTMMAGSLQDRARRATKILFELIESPQKAPIQESLDMDVIFRTSTGPCSE